MNVVAVFKCLGEFFQHDDSSAFPERSHRRAIERVASARWRGILQNSLEDRCFWSSMTPSPQRLRLDILQLRSLCTPRERNYEDEQVSIVIQGRTN